jgi:hypothetical protein
VPSRLDSLAKREAIGDGFTASVRDLLHFRKGQRLAEWLDAKGKRRTAPLTAAGNRIAVEAGTYTALLFWNTRLRRGLPRCK